MNIGFIGLGKLGMPCAEVMAEKHTVFGYDVSPKVSVSVKIVSEIGEAVEGMDLVFIAVPTPHDPLYEGINPLEGLPSKDFDYSYLISVIDQLDPFLTEGQTIVVISTCLPGTCDEILHPRFHAKVNLLYNPYFIAMGTVKEDFLNPEFIIIGSDNGTEEETKPLVDFYRDVVPNGECVTATWSEAECVKVFYNTFISTKIAFVNMIQDVAVRLPNTNVDVITRALGKGNRRLISTAYMQAGMGDGGACHPRDNIALMNLSERLDLGYDLFGTISTIRERQARNMAEYINGASTSKIVVIIGESYKPGVHYKDGSYSILVGHYLAKLGFDVHYQDELTGSREPDHQGARTYLLGHPTKTYAFREGSTVIDPWRMAESNDPTVEIIHYGDSR